MTRVSRSGGLPRRSGGGWKRRLPTKTGTRVIFCVFLCVCDFGVSGSPASPQEKERQKVYDAQKEKEEATSQVILKIVVAVTMHTASFAPLYSCLHLSSDLPSHRQVWVLIVIAIFYHVYATIQQGRAYQAVSPYLSRPLSRARSLSPLSHLHLCAYTDTCCHLCSPNCQAPGPR